LRALSVATPYPVYDSENARAADNQGTCPKLPQFPTSIALQRNDTMDRFC
jgi:hypothetical protein